MSAEGHGPDLYGPEHISPLLRRAGQGRDSRRGDRASCRSKPGCIQIRTARLRPRFAGNDWIARRRRVISILALWSRASATRNSSLPRLVAAKGKAGLIVALHEQTRAAQGFGKDGAALQSASADAQNLTSRFPSAFPSVRAITRSVFYRRFFVSEQRGATVLLLSSFDKKKLDSCRSSTIKSPQWTRCATICSRGHSICSS